MKQKYVEAEELLRQTVQGQERTLGVEHRETLESKHWLGINLIRQRKYIDAEELLRQTVQGQERTLGVEHKETLRSKYWLGINLHKRQKYIEAEELLRQTVQGQERTLGVEYRKTLESKHWLGRNLYRQRKYIEAEELLRQTIQGRERTLGVEHRLTLESKSWLGTILHKQQKHVKAKQVPQQTVQRQEGTLKVEHEETIDSKHLLQETKLNLANPRPNDVSIDIMVQKSLDNFFAEKRSSSKYTDLEIDQTSSLLDRLNPVWGKIPRTYIVLRTIECQNVLNEFIDLGFSDHWFPVTEKSLPNCLSSTQREQFVAAQDIVITKSVDFEQGAKGQHAYFGKNERVPLEEKGRLGSGGFGQVDKVLSSISLKEYARKRVPRSRAFGGRQTEAIKQFMAEIAILKRLEHQHVVEFIGSYTDSRYVGLLMLPIAETNLSDYLARKDSSRFGELRTYFGCLARALEFLHEEKVRHKDIKPSNILLQGGNILFTDFGLSLDFTDADGSTTVSMVNGMTARYCAPEVAKQESRNTASDVWSLGVVFLEMLVVLKLKSVDYMKEFFRTHGNRQEYVRTNPLAMSELVTELSGTEDTADDRVFGWLQLMLQEEQSLRPTAATLVTSIIAPHRQSDGDGRYCGICCVDVDDEFEQTDEHFEDDMDI